MAWKCKKCGSEVIGTANVYELLDFKLDKDGKLDKFDSLWGLEETIKERTEAENYYCKCCGKSDDELEEIAYWEGD